MSRIMTLFDIPNHYDLNTVSEYHTDKNTIMDDIKKPGTGYGNYINHAHQSGDKKNILGLSEESTHRLLDYTGTKLEQLRQELEDRAKRHKKSDVQMEEQTANDIINEIKRSLAVVPNNSLESGGALTLIDWELKKARAAQKRTDAQNVNTEKSYMRGREIRETKQAIMRAKMKQGDMVAYARLANRNLQNTQKVLEIQQLTPIKPRGKASTSTFPRNSVSFSMGTGNP